jgi:DNA-binding XRE family transcriptional regulator
MTGADIRRARRRLKWTQEQLGEALGLHWNTIARMERNELPIMKTTELAVRFLLLTVESRIKGRGKQWR